MGIVHVTEDAVIRLENAFNPAGLPAADLVASAIVEMLIPDEQRLCCLDVELPPAIAGAVAELAAARGMTREQLIDHAIRVMY